MKDVVIYTKSWCGYCTRAKALLTRKGAAFTEIEISGDDLLRDQMIARAGGRRTVPRIFIRDTHVGGCDDLYELESKNKQDALISMDATYPEIRPGHRVRKGEEVGYFQYGGSTCCLIFQPGAIAGFTPEALPQPENPDPPLVLLGTRIATAN